MNAAIVCDGKELETYDMKQEGTSSLTAFIASEAGKVRAFQERFPPLGLTHYEPPRNQSFRDSAIQNHVHQQFDKR